jgi:hypothetical protein
MTREDITRMAREAGFLVDEADFITTLKNGRIGFQIELERFAALAAATEREAQRKLLTEIRDALRRMDPAWCTLAGKAQLSDQELDEILGRLEDAVEDGDGTTA